MIFIITNYLKDSPEFGEATIKLNFKESPKKESSPKFLKIGVLEWNQFIRDTLSYQLVTNCTKVIFAVMWRSYMYGSYNASVNSICCQTEKIHQNFYNVLQHL